MFLYFLADSERFPHPTQEQIVSYTGDTRATFKLKIDRWRMLGFPIEYVRGSKRLGDTEVGWYECRDFQWIKKGKFVETFRRHLAGLNPAGSARTGRGERIGGRK